MLAIISSFLIGVFALLFGAAAHDNRLKGEPGSWVGLAIAFTLLGACVATARYL